MADYQLELRQVVDYPRCRIYREFMQTLIADRSIRTGGCSGLFYYVVLCSYANFRTSYRRIDGITYTVYPGEWVCTLKELAEWLRLLYHRYCRMVSRAFPLPGICNPKILAGSTAHYIYPPRPRAYRKVLHYGLAAQ